ncbi:MAG: SDR family NAD(P)-dependent oxidoreductase [Gammaproteobacteria bacterium]
MADMGANIIAVARDSNKAADLQQAVRDHCGREIRVLLGDLNSIAQTRAVAQTLLVEDQPIDVLINNAGALFNQRDVTAEGFEKSLALLLLSPFVLTESLLPLLRKRGGRVVNVVSGGLYTQPIRLDDLHYEKGTYNGAKAYARAKRGLLDMTRRWAQQPENTGVVFHAMHPGWADTQAVMDSLPGFYRITKPFLRDTVQGADTIVWLASAPEPTTCNGGFWLDRQLHTSAIFANTETSPANREQLYRMLQDLAATVPVPN